MALSDQHRTKLDGIVSQATANGEAPETIQAIVNDFKSKYDAPPSSGVGKKIASGVLNAAVPGFQGLNAATDLAKIVSGQPIKEVTANPTQTAEGLVNDVTAPGASTSILPAAIRGVASSTLLGQGNRAAAGIMAPFSDKNYDQLLQEGNARDAEVKAAAPTVYGLSQMGGMFLGGPQAIADSIGAGAVKLGSKVVGKVGKGLLNTLANLTQAGAAGAEGHLANNPDATVASTLQSGVQSAPFGLVNTVVGGLTQGLANQGRAAGLNGPHSIGKAANEELGFQPTMASTESSARALINDLGKKRSSLTEDVAANKVPVPTSIDAEQLDKIKKLYPAKADQDTLKVYSEKITPQQLQGVPAMQTTDPMAALLTGQPKKIMLPGKTLPPENLNFREVEDLKSKFGQYAFTQNGTLKNSAVAKNNAANSGTLLNTLKKQMAPEQAARYEALDEQMTPLYRVKQGAQQAQNTAVRTSGTDLLRRVLGASGSTSLLHVIGQMLKSQTTARLGGAATGMLINPEKTE